MKTVSGPILVSLSMSFPPAQTFSFQQPPEQISLPPCFTNVTNKISSSSPVKLIISSAALHQIFYWLLNPSFCFPREFFILANAAFESLSQKMPLVEPKLCFSHLPSVHYTAWTVEDQSHFFSSPWSNFVLKLNYYWVHQWYQWYHLSFLCHMHLDLCQNWRADPGSSRWSHLSLPEFISSRGLWLTIWNLESGAQTEGSLPWDTCEVC